MDDDVVRRTVHKTLYNDTPTKWQTKENQHYITYTLCIRNIYILNICSHLRTDGVRLWGTPTQLWTIPAALPCRRPDVHYFYIKYTLEFLHCCTIRELHTESGVSGLHVHCVSVCLSVCLFGRHVCVPKSFRDCPCQCQINT